jgi:hypothetical protein
MKTVHDFTYMGKKQAVGSLIWDEHDRMFIFVTYCPNCHHKVLFTRDEAYKFAKKYYREQHKIRTRFVIKMIRQ